MTVRAKGAAETENAYFAWMLHLVRRKGRAPYQKLMRLLHDTVFIPTLEMDVNRADDGVDLRYRFAYETNRNEHEVERAFRGKACSMLEMMVALSKRCEEHITDDPESGDRTGEWFWEMVESLGLLGMDDSHYEKAYAMEVLSRFRTRDYQPDGRGGLFTVHDSPYDLRDAEIWYQMMWYLNENLYG